MQLNLAANIILKQLSDVVEQISEADFRKPSQTLNATVGQHLRHIVEFFICLLQGYPDGVVNYDKRIHNQAMENDKYVTLHAIKKIQDFIHATQGNKALKLEAGYLPDSDEFDTISTNYLRELFYNIEHAVHHMAFMKIGIREVADYIILPASFGVAVSTLRYQQALVAAN